MEGNPMLDRELITRAFERAEVSERFFEEQPIMNFIIDKQRARFIRANKLARKILGYSSEFLASKPFTYFMHPDDIERSMKAFEHYKKSNEMFHGHEYFINRYRKADGAYIELVWLSFGEDIDEVIYATSAIPKDMLNVR
jgi:PAS domain S-box-containing protein